MNAMGATEGDPRWVRFKVVFTDFGPGLTDPEVMGSEAFPLQARQVAFALSGDTSRHSSILAYDSRNLRAVGVLGRAALLLLRGGSPRVHLRVLPEGEGWAAPGESIVDGSDGPGAADVFLSMQEDKGHRSVLVFQRGEGGEVEVNVVSKTRESPCKMAVALYAQKLRGQLQLLVSLIEGQGVVCTAG